MNKEKVHLIQLTIGILSLVTIVISVFNITINALDYNDLKKEEAIVVKEVSVAKKEYTDYKKNIEEQVYAESDSKNELVKGIANHNSSYQIMNNLANEFFKTYFTWKDSKEYQQRKENSKNIADVSLLNNKDIFDDGKDTTGGDYIKALGVQSEFIHSEVNLVDNQTGIAKVTYKSWYDEKSKSGEGVRYYQVSFNRENQKISDIKLVFSSEN